jgi:molecular chaperone DnaK (HSP70)
MKFSRILAVVVSIIFIFANIAAAAPEINSPFNFSEIGQKSEASKMDGEKSKEKCDSFNKDPLKFLESRKEKIQQLLKEGKITKEKADEMTARVDKKIKDINEFNKLGLKQKREKLIKDFNASIDKKVGEGKLTREKADSLVKEYKDKIEKWDGTGYPRFHGKHSRYKGKCP